MLANITNLESFEEKSKTILPVDVFSFISSGSLDEKTFKRNKQKFNDLLIYPRVLCGLKDISTEVEILGSKLRAPFCIAPAAFQKLLSPHGELDMLEAASIFNTIFTVSMFSSVDYKVLTKRAKNPLWLQMYLLKDRSINKRLIEVAEKSGFQALVITVDTPVYAKRDRELTNPLHFPPELTFEHLEKIGLPFGEYIKAKGHPSQLLDPHLSWKDIEWVAKQTKLPLILKGIIATEDTQIAIQYPSIKGIIISNHGGRQLDSTFSPIEIIQEHKNIVGEKLLLMLDGGISRGSDIFKALALGADSVLLGRSLLYALSVGGAQGVLHAFHLLHNELIEVMILAGCSTLEKITSSHVKMVKNVGTSDHEIYDRKKNALKIVA